MKNLLSVLFVFCFFTAITSAQFASFTAYASNDVTDLVGDYDPGPSVYQYLDGGSIVSLLAKAQVSVCKYQGGGKVQGNAWASLMLAQAQNEVGQIGASASRTIEGYSSDYDDNSLNAAFIEGWVNAYVAKQTEGYAISRITVNW